MLTFGDTFEKPCENKLDSGEIQAVHHQEDGQLGMIVIALIKAIIINNFINENGSLQGQANPQAVVAGQAGWFSSRAAQGDSTLESRF